MKTRHPGTLAVIGLCLSLPLAFSACSKGCWSRLHQVPGEPDSDTFKALSHGAWLSLDPGSHGLELIDTLYYEGAFSQFTLNSQLTVTALEIGGRSYPLKKLIALPADNDSSRISYQLCKRPPDADRAVIHARGVLYQNPDQMVFGHERVGQELSATIGPEGAWLAGSAMLFPTIGDQNLPLRLHADLPGNWSVMSHGRLVSDTMSGGRHQMVWHNDERGHSPDIVAGEYSIRREDHAGVSVETWFLRHDAPQIGIDGQPVDDDAVRSTLHRMSNYYLDMYTELVGPYPYGRFSVVESFFPSGYGMPGWTLLGSQVIRMPYIPYTSLGHELLHNYWGNGVGVNPAQGNWCEGLTVYQADYRYKSEDSPEAGRAYRKDTLKSWLAWTREGSDLPLNAFMNRHDGATRAVGYGKSMMVFVMLEDLLGREVLEGALRDVFRDFRGREASWSDIFAACETRGHTDLSRFASQWLTRTGAPLLGLAPGCAWDDGKLHGELVQLQPGAEELPYELDVRLEVECHDGTVLHPLVYMDGARQSFEVECPEPRRVQVDPDIRLFRQLHEGEIEAIVSMVMAEKRPLVVAPDLLCSSEEGHAALKSFGETLFESNVAIMRFSDFDAMELGWRSVIFVSPPLLPPGLEPANVSLGTDEWRVAEHTGKLGEASLVLALKSSSDPGKCGLLVLPTSLDQLPVLARKVPHYGKYSVLAFDGKGTNILKDNLEPRGNPLDVRFGSW